MRSTPRHLRKALALAIFTAVLAACATVPAQSLTKHKPRPLFWGAQIGKQLTGESAPWDMRAISKFEHIAHKDLSIVSFPSPFADCSPTPCSFFPFPTVAMENLRQHGALPFLSWASQSVPSGLDEPEFQLSDIVAGTYDSYIRDFAEAAREWGHPFFLRFDPEMNGFWFPWSEGVNGNAPGQFVTAWRHVHDIFTSVGATNATWVWCPNVDFTRKLTPLSHLYPGGKYVDWTCLDGFNWGRTANSAGWMSFSGIFRSTYDRIVKIAPHKPMVIGETASEERGGSKASWIRNALRVIPSKFRKVRGLIWFEENDQGMHWPIESSSASARAFAGGIQSSLYEPNLYAELPNGPIRPPDAGR